MAAHDCSTTLLTKRMYKELFKVYVLPSENQEDYGDNLLNLYALPELSVYKNVVGKVLAEVN